VSDELAFSLLGDYHFYGTPLNPKAPDRVPGGSSSGSASAVACGLVDFGLGTDTGGSVRVPANNCGVWGMRPSHGFISVAGVNPLAPTFDTVGILASSAEALVDAASVLMACEDIPDEEPATIHFLQEAFSIADPDVQQALKNPVRRLRSLFGWRLRDSSVREIGGESTKPAFGPEASQNFDLVKSLDRPRVKLAAQRREEYFRRLKSFLGPKDLLCMLTTPALAPLKGTIAPRGRSATGDYYPRTLSLLISVQTSKPPILAALCNQG